MGRKKTLLIRYSMRKTKYYEGAGIPIPVNVDVAIYSGYSANSIQVLSGYSANMLQILSGYSANSIQILSGYSTNIIQILYGYTDTAG